MELPPEKSPKDCIAFLGEHGFALREELIDLDDDPK
jgi:hypothetical protein